MDVFINVILPVFLVVGSGFLVGKIFKGNGEIFSKITLWIFSSVITFTFMNENPPNTSDLMKYLWGFLSIFAYNLILFRWILRNKENSDVYFLTSLFGNTGYLGYPILGSAFGDIGITYGVMYSFVSVTLVNTLGIAFLIKDLKKSLQNLFKLPFIYSIVLGMGLGYMGVHWKNFPKPISAAIADIKGAAIPVIMVFLGYSLSKAKLSRKNLVTMTLASVHRLFVIPIIAFVVSELLGMKGILRDVFIIESAMPTAMNVVVISAALNKKPDLMSSVVALSTAISAATISTWIYILGR